MEGHKGNRQGGRFGASGQVSAVELASTQSEWGMEGKKEMMRERRGWERWAWAQNNPTYFFYYYSSIYGGATR